MAESSFATLKAEVLHRRTWPTRAAARLAIFEDIDRVPRTGEVWYNRQLLHSTLGYVSPPVYQETHRQAAAA